MPTATNADLLACTDFVLDVREACAKHALGLAIRDGQLCIVDVDGNVIVDMYLRTILPAVA